MPGETCTAVNIDTAGKTIQSVQVTTDRLGLVTFPRFQLTHREGNRLVLAR